MFSNRSQSETLKNPWLSKHGRADLKEINAKTCSEATTEDTEFRRSVVNTIVVDNNGSSTESSYTSIHSSTVTCIQLCAVINQTAPFVVTITHGGAG